MRDETAPDATRPQPTTLPRFPLPADAPTPAEPETRDATPKTPRWAWAAWARQWEFWLALAVAAFLRLWRIDLTPFLGDQVELMRLTRAAITQGALPLTGIPSSVGTLNPPIAIYLIMPFVTNGTNPLAVVISIALWNILGVALCYIFALRYFGRRIAAVGTLLFATCDATVYYSRFLWQQNYLPPLFALWAITLYAGCVQGRKHWLIANATILLAAALLHPVGALLIPVTIIGVFLAPQRPRLWEYVIVAVIAGLLLAPTLLWEYVSGWSDVHLLLRLATGHGSFDLAVFGSLYRALGAPGELTYGPNSLDARFNLAFSVINVIAVIVFALGYVALTLRVWRPLLALWRSAPITPGGGSVDPTTGTPAFSRTPTFAQAYQHAAPRERLGLLGRWAVTGYRRLRADASLRAQALLWLWIGVPIAALIHHSSPIYTHYLMVLYPGAFIVGGFAATDIPRWLAGRQHASRAPSPFVRFGEGTRGGAPAIPRWASLGVGLTLAALIVAQGAQATLDTATLLSPGFQALTNYGYPLSAAQQLDREISALQRQQGASNVVIVPPSTLTAAQLDYLLTSERPDRVSATASCLLLPPPDAGPTLIVAADTPSPINPATGLLPSLPNARGVGRLPALGSAPLQAYLAQGADTLPDATPLAVNYRDAQGDALTLVGASVTAPGLIRLRWRIDAAPAGHWFRFAVQPTTPTVKRTPGVAPVGGAASCQPAHWAAGETIYTWMGFLTTKPGALSVSVSAGTFGFASPTIGGVHFLADAPANATMVPLTPMGSTPSLTV